MAITITTTLPGSTTAITMTALSAQQVGLSTSNVALTVPTGARYVLVQPPSSNAFTITMKGVNGDTGVALARSIDSLTSLDTGATVVLLAGGSVTVTVAFIA